MNVKQRIAVEDLDNETKGPVGGQLVEHRVDLGFVDEELSVADREADAQPVSEARDRTSCPERGLSGVIWDTTAGRSC